MGRACARFTKKREVPADRQRGDRLLRSVSNPAPRARQRASGAFAPTSLARSLIPNRGDLGIGREIATSDGMEDGMLVWLGRIVDRTDGLHDLVEPAARRVVGDAGLLRETLHVCATHQQQSL